MADPKNSPDYKSKAFQQTADAIKVVRDVSGGTATMRAAGVTYLPKEPRETPLAYQDRLNRTVLFDGYSKTVKSFVGMVSQNDIVLGDDVPPLIREHLEDVDLAGSHIDVFAKSHFEDQFEGCSLILVDMDLAENQPKITMAGNTRADQVARRPYWVKYKHDDVLNFRKQRINGRDEFTQITLQETTCEPDGDYGETEVTRYRTFRKANGIVSWELHRLNPESKSEDDKIILEKEGTTTLSRIPVAVAGELGKLPPLLGIAYLNISHWQNSSDQENILHITRVPMLVRIGATPEKTEVQVGVTSTLDAPQGGDYKWLEIKSDGAMAVGRQHLLDIEQRMGMMGLSTLTQRSDADITATEKKQDFKEKHSDLATMARNEKDAIELALSFHAEYLGLDSGGSIELGVRDEQLTLTPQHLQVLLTAVEGSNFSVETFLSVVVSLLTETGHLPEGVTVESEIKKIEAAKKKAEAMNPPASSQTVTVMQPQMNGGVQ